MKDYVSGTGEWADENINCVTGCRHNCRYCYARQAIVDLYQQIAPEEWENSVVRTLELHKNRHKTDKVYMFPTSHDILPETLDDCMAFLGGYLVAGNRVLVVSKPHLECIAAICDRFKEYKEQILFRFSIGAFRNDILKFWEPGAPSYEERTDCLKLALDKGFRTSVSAEPMLDTANIIEHVERLLPLVSDTIWLGKMNRIGQCVKINNDMDRIAVARIKTGQANDRIWAMYFALKNNPQIRWKENIKKVVGLPLATETGLDI